MAGTTGTIRTTRHLPLCVMFVFYSYATPSAFESTKDRNTVGLAANARRPVRFHGRVKSNPFMIRIALRSLGEVIWSNNNYDSWLNSILDPIITVHPDQTFFEAFSQDQSAYAQVRLDPALFETDGEVISGTTNVDFTAWLWAALAELRSNRETWFRIDPSGFEVTSEGAGGRFEQKVDIPDPWVRGFLALQDAMAMPGTRFTCRPVDLLAAIRYLKYSKARISPRAIRYEFDPGEEVKIVLEPWEESIPLKGTEHNYQESHSIRVWGRRRLSLLEPLLPFADSVDVYLKGRALPSFYIVHLPNGIQFVLGLSGWSATEWSKPGGLSLLGGLSEPEPEIKAEAYSRLTTDITISARKLSNDLGCELPEANQALRYLCREGLAIYDLDTRNFRHRELFEEKPDWEALFPPDLRSENASKLLKEGKVKVNFCEIEEMAKVKNLKTPEGKVTREIVYRDWKVEGKADVCDVQIKINDHGKIIFGTCGCKFFRENILNLGPCEHMQALFEASSDQRTDQPSSTAVDRNEARPPGASLNYELDDEGEFGDEEE